VHRLGISKFRFAPVEHLFVAVKKDPFEVNKPSKYVAGDVLEDGPWI
jgi:hypothetical protein